MQFLAEAEDLPKTATINTGLISLWTAPVFGVVLLIAFLAAALIRFSLVTFHLCGIRLLPIFMVIVVQMKRMATQSHAVKVNSRQVCQGRHR
jgi:hypothetical protein